MHALPAYLNGASNCPRGRARRDEELDVLNVLMRSIGFVRDARVEVRSTGPQPRKRGRSHARPPIPVRRRSV
jgi:hypothetical protein